MSKKHKVTQIDIERNIMDKVRSNQITMKPRWYFILGSFFMMCGLVGFSVGAVFLTNLMLFLLRKHGPMGQWRLQILLDSFPWWIPVLAVVGMGAGILMLKKYDFSYRKNFIFIVFCFVISIIVSAFLIDSLGFNEMWSRGPMRRFYQQIEKENNNFFPRGSGQARHRGV